MIRRTFELPDEVTDEIRASGRGQILVTYDAATDTLHVAHRIASYSTWSRPFPEIEGTRQDDAEPGYRPKGLRYDDPAALALGASSLIREWDEITGGRGRMMIVAPAHVLDQIEFVTIDVPDADRVILDVVPPVDHEQ